MLGREPLIYMRKKKNIVGSSPQPPVVVYDSYPQILSSQEYPTSTKFNFEWFICKLPQRVAGVQINGRPTDRLRRGSSYAIRLIVVEGNGTNNSIYTQSQNMRWLNPGGGSQSMWSVAYCWYISNDNNVSKIQKIMNSNLTNPYEVGPHIDRYTIQDPIATSQYWYISRIEQNTTVIQTIEQKLRALNKYGTNGMLLMSDTNLDNATISSIYSGSGGFNNWYGSKSGVEDLDIA